VQPESGSAALGEPRIPERRPHPLGALGFRDFRLLISGQLVSQLGTWMQFTSLTYFLGVVLARSQAQSALNLGFLAAAQAIPVLLLSPIAGFVADRHPRRRTLMVVAIARAGLALGLALVSRQRADWVVGASFAIAAAYAAAQSFDPPTRQSWISFLVPRSLLGNAIGLGALANNAPLMIGPAIAGILIGTVGVYASFLVNAVSQFAVVVAVALMRPVPVSSASREPMLRQIATGIRFVASHPLLRWIVAVLIVSSLCVRPYNLLLAGFAGHVLNVGAKAYGTMLAVGGIGTVMGALSTAMFGVRRRAAVSFISLFVTCVSLVSLGWMRNWGGVLGALLLMGFGTMSYTSSTNVIIQTEAPDEMRGRALSLYSMIILGFVPLGGLVLGALASAIGLPPAYAVGGGVGIAAVVLVWAREPAVRRG
jgi:MFS family permease